MSARKNLLNRITFEMMTNDSEELIKLHTDVRNSKGLIVLGKFEKVLEQIHNDRSRD